jgi:hypothetical protein
MTNTTEADLVPAEEAPFSNSDLNFFNGSTATPEGIEKLNMTVDTQMAYHPWTPEQVASGEKVRDAIGEAIKAIYLNVPSCPTRTRAINHLIDARMIANAAITFCGHY